VPFVPFVALGCAALVANLDGLRIDLGWPSVLEYVLLPMQILLGFSIPLTLIWLAHRVRREEERLAPHSRAPRRVRRWHISWRPPPRGSAGQPSTRQASHRPEADSTYRRT
jgi:hypothetical protein